MTALGARLSAKKLTELLAHLVAVNRRVEGEGENATPICIWGSHGIGKTMLVASFAARNGFRFAYCAPAQFEEMGDLNGMPVVTKEGQTSFAPPAWVPREEGPGILLLDDINRADDRILRGLMQLLQTGGLVAWRLPPGWQIIATANPEDAEYSVTPMDDAMLTRMAHVTMQFELASWVEWAEGASVDPRGVEFVIAYPEVMAGRRTTPRTLTSFFRAIAHLDDLSANPDLVQALALSSLDDATAAAFLAYVEGDVVPMPTAHEILHAIDSAPIYERIASLGQVGSEVKIDRLSILCTRLAHQVTKPGFVLTDRARENLVRFVLEGPVPADLRMSLHRQLVASPHAEVRATLATPRVAARILEEMG